MLSIIGSGRVGSATAFLTASKSIDNIQLVNRHMEKALAQAMDISNAIPKNSPNSVVAADYSDIKNSDVMSFPLTVISPDDIIWEAAEIMKANKIHKAPVHDDEGKLVGIIHQLI